MTVLPQINSKPRKHSEMRVSKRITHQNEFSTHEIWICSITSWHGNAFRFIGTLWELSAGLWWIPLAKVVSNTDIFFDVSLNKLSKMVSPLMLLVASRRSRDLTVMPWIYYHYNDVIISAMASQITSLTIVYSTVYSGADQRRYQSSASLAFVRGNHRWPVNSPHKWTVTRKMFPFDNVIMI